MNPYLFAYGFLKTKYHGSKTTNTPDFRARLIGKGYYTGRIYRVASYPGVIFDLDNTYEVVGEIFELKNPQEDFKTLDEYEHASPLITNNPDYQRVIRKIKHGNQTIECWVYEYLLPVSPESEITTGEF